MSENPKTVGETIGSIMNSITSPAKLAFAGYVLLVYSGKIQPLPTALEFLLIAAVFFILQVLHDDYLRPLLNNLAGKEETSHTKGRTTFALIGIVLLLVISLFCLAIFGK